VADEAERVAPSPITCRPPHRPGKLHDTQWCLEAQHIGPSCYALVHSLFGDQVLVKLRAVKGVLRFAQQFGATRLEAARRRGNHCGTPSYKAVKLILQKGLEQTWLSYEPVQSGATTYTHGGRFCRDSQTLLIH